MKKYVKIIMLLALFGVTYGDMQAQKKKTIKRSTVKTTKVKFTPKEFGTPASLSEVTDVNDSTPGYQSIKTLVETNGVTLVYADNTFRPKDPLRRGDFIVTFNSALDAVKKATDAGGVDNSVINTYDKSQSYVTSVSEITDLQESSVYYPAAQSLIERWGIAAPFSKSKLLNAGAPMTEGEVYDILKQTLGYVSPGTNPYSTAMTRAKFATVLNNAVGQKLVQVNTLAVAKTDSLDDLRRQQEALIKQQDKQRRDSLTKEVELSKIEAQKREAEAWTKLSDKEKRKQLKSQSQR
ncbi:MAG: S-layer homology domain-containing protein [Ginsengibacter sp.]